MSGTWSRKRRTPARQNSAPAPHGRQQPGSISSHSLNSLQHANTGLGIALPPSIQQDQAQLSRSTDKMFEDAELCGVLSLVGRKLREFPTHNHTKYDLSDLVAADLSSNRLSEIPSELYDLRSLESLRLRENTLKRISSQIGLLDALGYLDISNNHLSQLPLALFELPLEILLICGNRLQTLPREIRQLANSLTELNVSYNQLKTIPADIALLKMLRVLNLSNNELDQFPSELCRLSLQELDLSSNKFTQLPLHLRKMKSLLQLRLHDNPLQSPPAHIIAKGREHIFKWMDIECGGGAAAPVRAHHSSSTLRALNLGRMSTLCGDDREVVARKISGTSVERRPRTARFHTVGGSDSGYASTASEHRLSRELATSSGLDDINEYTVFSPSPDEGIQVSETDGLLRSDSNKSWRELSSEESKLPVNTKVSPRTPPSGPTDRTVLDTTIGCSTKGLGALMDVYDRTMAPVRTPILVSPLAAPEDTEDPKEPTLESRKCQEARKNSGNNNTVSNGLATKAAEPQTNGVDVKNNNNSVGPVNVAKKDGNTCITNTNGFTPTTSKPISKVAPLINTTIKKSPAQKNPSTINGVTAKVPASKLHPPGATKPVVSPSSLGSRLPARTATTTAGSASTVKKTSIPSTSSSNTSNSSISSRSRVAAASTGSRLTSRTGRGPVDVRPSVSQTHEMRSRKPSLSKGTSTDSVGSSQLSVNPVEATRRTMLDRIGVSLSANRDTLATQLSTGVHLCTLVNALRPKTIAMTSIQVDEKALSPMKARKNADNFVGACKRLGVPEPHCSAADITGKRNLLGIARTVQGLVRHVKPVVPPSPAGKDAENDPLAAVDCRLVTNV